MAMSKGSWLGGESFIALILGCSLKANNTQGAAAADRALSPASGCRVPGQGDQPVGPDVRPGLIRAGTVGLLAQRPAGDACAGPHGSLAPSRQVQPQPRLLSPPMQTVHWQVFPVKRRPADHAFRGNMEGNQANAGPRAGLLARRSLLLRFPRVGLDVRPHPGQPARRHCLPWLVNSGAIEDERGPDPRPSVCRPRVAPTQQLLAPWERGSHSESLLEGHLSLRFPFCAAACQSPGVHGLYGRSTTQGAPPL